MDLIKTLNYCRTNWARPHGLIVSIVLAIGLLVFLFLNIQIERLSFWHWVALVITPLILTVIWWRTTRLPCVPKGTIGFGVAIRTENQDQAKKLKADFIKRLRELVGTWRTGSVAFLDLGASPVEDLLVDPAKHIVSIHNQTRCHFLIWGDAKERNIDGPKHVLELEGSVCHAPIPGEAGAALSAEFRDLFPRRVLLEKEKDLFTFQFTAQWIDVVAQYVIAIASYLSGDLDHAESLFLTLHQRLDKTAPSHLPQIAKIRARVPSRIAEVYKTKLSYLSTKYHMSRSPELLMESEKVLAQLDLWEPSYYGLHLTRAMCHFLLRRDVQAAAESLKKCENVDDGTWLWSRAFLEAYSGDLESAYRSYQKAFATKTGNENVPLQCEEFIYLVMETEPDKGQLFYALGLINLRGKPDLISARRDLVLFLDWVERTKQNLSSQVSATRKWIAEIDEELDKTSTHA
ncbi:hypothetical protein [Prosthecobacter sp.]|uniref:hypothetical protein n=1 Tax=Prosthecobacter sp. TaxID=1965333 RepID=UPI002AB85539|nr:hypothetical protein [Prosthecobacter sp.]MDZ4401218.1 hypothetical protein [Prosthecobacter sp.]